MKFRSVIIGCFLSLLMTQTQANAAIIFQNDDFATVESTNLIINSDNGTTTPNISIEFATSTLSQTITWNIALDRFQFSNDIDVLNNQIYQFRAENVGSMPTIPGPYPNQIGRIVELTGTDNSAPGCTPVACSSGTYSWNGTIWKPLQGSITTSNATKIVTVGPTGRDYTNIADAATYLNTLSGGEMWVDPGNYPVTTTVNLANIRVVGTETAQTTVVISGAGRLDVKDTDFTNLTFDINPTGNFGINAYDDAAKSTIEFDEVDFKVANLKNAIDSNAASEPDVIIELTNCTQSLPAAGDILDDTASSNLSASTTVTILDQTGLNPLRINDWPVTIIGGSNVLTSGQITTVPDRTILVSAGMNIQTAINSLGASGGVIKLLIGTHTITNEITISNNNIEIVGEGPGTLVQTGTWGGLSTINNCAIQVGGATGTTPRSNVIVRNFKLQVAPNIHGICFNGGSENKAMDLIIESIGTKNTTRTGLVFTDGASAAGSRFTATRNIITSNNSTNSWVDGIHFDGNNEVPPSTLAGQVFGYNNTILDSIISENIVNEAQESSFVFSAVNASGIFSNRARNIGATSGALGLALNDVQDVMVINNTIEAGTSILSNAVGISVFDNVDDSVILGNAIRGNPTNPSNFTTGINIATNTSERNIINNNQIAFATTKIQDLGTNTRLETNNKTATTAPTATDDINDGFAVGTFWINTAADAQYVLTNSTAGAAVWTQLASNAQLSSLTGTTSASWTIDNDNASGNITLQYGDGTPTNESLVWDATNLRFDLSDDLSLAGELLAGLNGNPNTTVDINGDLAMRRADITLVNGANNNINIGTASFVRVTGPTGAFSITGIAGGVDGKVVILFNSTNQAMTITSLSGSSTAANQIDTLVTGGGANFVTTAQGSIMLIYDGNSSKWIAVGQGRT